MITSHAVQLREVRSTPSCAGWFCCRGRRQGRYRSWACRFLSSADCARNKSSNSDPCRQHCRSSHRRRRDPRKPVRSGRRGGCRLYKVEPEGPYSPLRLRLVRRARAPVPAAAEPRSEQSARSAEEASCLPPSCCSRVRCRDPAGPQRTAPASCFARNLAACAQCSPRIAGQYRNRLVAIAGGHVQDSSTSRRAHARPQRRAQQLDDTRR